MRSSCLRSFHLERERPWLLHCFKPSVIVEPNAGMAVYLLRECTSRPFSPGFPVLRIRELSGNRIVVLFVGRMGRIHFFESGGLSVAKRLRMLCHETKHGKRSYCNYREKQFMPLFHRAGVSLSCPIALKTSNTTGKATFLMSLWSHRCLYVDSAPLGQCVLGIA